ncbi:GNAT family N-acetyltransferase [Geomicrobium sediminis]|uniref:RimJ/RimL family protein N-acetyltransferase n=1 Tax=Geomicrobium sediminis TaxID=1347788 RepID=A0ABS2PI25_9BACL|nr:GNAT family N-acetyltransferase [Geomicrobium sediminis]MBM7634756.1 RimJ/RimL family protein N-acetyltransferase [Geomicrobium sediminis]
MIRQLHPEDQTYYEQMDTGIEDDYIAAIFPYLVTGPNKMYGLFIENQLVSTAGFTIYHSVYAMLGRLRTDRRYRGQNLATEILNNVLERAWEHSEIQWVGANTQQSNIPAQKVLRKIGLTPRISLQSATTTSPNQLADEHAQWTEITSLSKKKTLLSEQYVQPGRVFPYECYYPFEAKTELFHDDEVATWRFFENNQCDRFFITKYDQKKYHYLHVVYPFQDLFNQSGLWATITHAHNDSQSQFEEDVHVWVDITNDQMAKLPNQHPFDLPSPWNLYVDQR